ncbi:succinylglutamate desuccinylase/aspartoacylase family protein [Endozoicomonas sp. 8E]|uniref:succinylglutamate desuccinylase/aspartoacylase family protein n=1 Tax=Endozoicomonas sp. 8E TaxID=3035692 RepID=UPI0029393FC5|nr:succinylglutamate desuccinylase/aspartoacylase family protein [Endozoicomonas sp. 8E]WOG27286.1 succinylglutamate desuccinylase/aspartoacylase family protein [Endozoicomonas sp. 8E]
MLVSDISIGGSVIKAGQTRQIRLEVAKLCTNTDFSLPVHVIHSKKTGPKVFVSAAVHGDELNGIEIIRRLINLKTFKVTMGTLILVPMVNVYGVLYQSRYLPDRRDLNRSFPGSPKGSLASRLAHIFLKEIVSLCEYGIDLHTGAIHRSNLPQIRANLMDKETLSLARAFGVPVLLNANIRDNSLRQAAEEFNARVLLYEAGEALRFDEVSIRAGVHGVINVLAELRMLRLRRKVKAFTPYIANKSSWVRANASGIINSLKNLGDQVDKGTPLATIGSPLGEIIDVVKATQAGIIIGKQNIPLVQEGEAMFHIAFFTASDGDVAEDIEMMQEELQTESSVLE